MPDVTFESSAESRKSGGFSEHHLPVRVADSGDRAICAYALQHPMKFIAHESIARARSSLTGPSYYGLLSGSKPLAHSGSMIQRNRSRCARISAALLGITCRSPHPPSPHSLRLIAFCFGRYPQTGEHLLHPLPPPRLAPTTLFSHYVLFRGWLCLIMSRRLGIYYIPDKNINSEKITEFLYFVCFYSENTNSFSSFLIFYKTVGSKF